MLDKEAPYFRQEYPNASRNMDKQQTHIAIDTITGVPTRTNAQDSKELLQIRDTNLNNTVTNLSNAFNQDLSDQIMDSTLNKQSGLGVGLGDSSGGAQGNLKFPMFQSGDS